MTKFLFLILFLVLNITQINAQQNERVTFSLECGVDQSSQFHSLWLGLRNPLRIVCSNSNLKFKLASKGADIQNVNNGNFDLIPNENEVVIFVVATSKNDTLHSFKLISKNTFNPNFTFYVKDFKVNDLAKINKNNLGFLQLKIENDEEFKKDLKELPKFKASKISIFLTREKKEILSMSNIEHFSIIKSKVKNGDKLLIFISEFTYYDASNKLISKKCNKYFTFYIA